MNPHIKETIEMILLNSEISEARCKDILELSDDYFAKHKATEIKAKMEDNVRLASALQQLIKEK